jgi:glycosyltransferase involved in cell wall biosynthesis
MTTGTPRRCRLLFVTNGFFRAGSERCLYEICSALDQRRFEIAVVVPRAFRPSPDQYYYSKLRDLGVVVHRRITRPVYFTRILGGIGRSAAWRGLVNRIHGAWLRWRLQGFRHHDLIACILIEPFKSLQYALRPGDPCVVHLMAHRFQYAYDPYADCRPDLPHRMIVMDPVDQPRDLAGTPCADAETFYFPMAMPFGPPPMRPASSRREPPFKIGIVSRVGPDRPLVPFFDALQRLRQTIDATLHIYGSGDARPFAADVERRGLSSAVVFEGHADNVAQRLKADGIDLVWMISIGAVIGYGSVEAAGEGLPVLFYNLSGLTRDEDVQRQTGGAMHAFSGAAALADFSGALLLDPERRSAAASRLCDYVRREHDIATHIERLQAYYLRIARTPALSRAYSERPADWIAS